MGKVEVSDLKLADLKKDVVDGFAGHIYRFTIEVPVDYIQRTDEGPLMAYNVSEHNLYEFMLGVKRGYLQSVTDGIARIGIEVGEAYINIVLADLKKVPRATVLTPETTEE